MDYNGVAHHPAQALEADAADDVDGALTSLDDEVPRLAAAHAAVRGHFAGIGDLGGVAAEDTCVEALADERLRAKFEAALTAFTRSMEIVLPSEKGLPYVAGRQGVRHDRAAGLPPLPRPRCSTSGSTARRCGRRSTRTCSRWESASESTRSPSPQPTTRRRSGADRSTGEGVGDGARHPPPHQQAPRQRPGPLPAAVRTPGTDPGRVEGPVGADRARGARLPARRHPSAPRRRRGLDPTTEAPFHDLLAQALIEHGCPDAPERAGPLRAVTIDVVHMVVVHLVKADVRQVGLWDHAHKREQLRRTIIHRLDETRPEDGSDLFDYAWLRPIADRLIELAKHNHHRLAAAP